MIATHLVSLDVSSFKWNIWHRLTEAILLSTEVTLPVLVL